jgi:hypothetical protein
VFNTKFTNASKKANEVKKTLTVVDMAGREDPLTLMRTLLSQQKWKRTETALGALISSQKNISEFKSVVPTIPKEDAAEIVKEGLYVNETLNELVRYFSKKSGNTVKGPAQNLTSWDEYDPSVGVYKTELKSTDRPLKLARDKELTPENIRKAYNNWKPDGQISMVSMLDFLNYGVQPEPSRPTKFVMLCAVRQEGKYCDDVEATLKFASAIKST